MPKKGNARKKTDPWASRPATRTQPHARDNNQNTNQNNPSNNNDGAGDGQNTNNNPGGNPGGNSGGNSGGHEEPTQFPLHTITNPQDVQRVQNAIHFGIKSISQLINMTETLIQKKRHHYYHTIEQRQALQNALDIQLEVLRPYDQIVLQHLRSIDKKAFTKKRIKSFGDLMTFLEGFVQIPVSDIEQYWQYEYPKITEVWGVTFNQYPQDEQFYNEDYESGYDYIDATAEEEVKPDDSKKTKKKDEKKSSDAKFDVDKRLNKKIRKEILAAGTGDKQELKKSFPAYLESNYNTKTTPKFSGEDPDVPLLTMWTYLQQIHLAPPTNISYAQKIQAVLFCLTGKAESRAIGFKNRTTRMDYMELWRELFIMFGDSSDEIALQEEILRNAHTKSNKLEDVASFLNEMTSAIRKLETRGEHTLDKYVNCWSLIIAQVREWFDKFVSDKDRSYFDEFGSCAREYYLSNPKEKFVKFREYIYHAEKEYRRDDTIKMGLYRAAVRSDRSPRRDDKEKEKERTKQNDKDEDRNQENKQKEKDNPRGRREPEKEGNSKKRKRSNERHVSTEPERKRRRDEDCFICLKPHDWVYCPKTIDEKLDIFTKYNLCKNCGRKGHVPRDCKTKVRCYHCRNDPTRLEYQKRHHSSICTVKYGQPKYPIRYTNQLGLAKIDLHRRTHNRYLENVEGRDKRNPTPPREWMYTRLASPDRSRNKQRYEEDERRIRQRSRSPRRHRTRSPRRRESRSPRRRDSRSPRQQQRSRRTPESDRNLKKRIAELEKQLKEEVNKSKKSQDTNKDDSKKI